MMMFRKLLALSVALATLPALAQQPQTAPAAHHLFFHVTLSPKFPRPVSGRMLVFLVQGSGKKELSREEKAYVAAREVDALAPGASVDVDGDEIASPQGMSQAPAGDYQAQVFLDVDHSFAYNGAGPGDYGDDPVALPALQPATAAPIALTLDQVAPPRPAHALSAGIEPFQFESPSLTAFWGRPILLRGYVVLPPSYAANAQAKYPTAYFTHGFGATFAYLQRPAESFRKMMDAKQMPEMIWVLLDESFPTGTVEFADSVNNGPWGHALTTELIPDLEHRYRMDAVSSGRFLNGHSSGGWATLWLQVAYPQIFGGTWSTSPDPSDFHNFTGPDLYAAHANVYRMPDGTPWMLVRDKGKDVMSLEQYARQEAVLGAYGGQMSSFDWVFSPKGPSGAPLPMFDRMTGDVDPAVRDYWAAHYDIGAKVKREWPRTGPDLKGKIHLIVGTADTFHLDESARLLEQDLKALGADAHFTYLPGKTHFDLYKEGDDPQALLKKIAVEMYAVARPKP